MIRLSNSRRATRWFRNLAAALRNQDGYPASRRIQGQFHHAHANDGVDDLHRPDPEDVDNRPTYTRLG